MAISACIQQYALYDMWMWRDAHVGEPEESRHKEEEVECVRRPVCRALRPPEVLDEVLANARQKCGGRRQSILADQTAILVVSRQKCENYSEGLQAHFQVRNEVINRTYLLK